MLLQQRVARSLGERPNLADGDPAARSHSLAVLDIGRLDGIAPQQSMCEGYFHSMRFIRSIWREITVELRAMFVATGVSATALAIAWANDVAGASEPVSIAFYAISYVAGGFFPIRAAVASTRARQLDVNILMITAAVGAAVLGFWEEGAVLMLLFTLSGTLETYALVRTRKAVEGLMSLRPDQARIEQADGEIDVPVDSVVPGDVIVLRPGDRVPVDGRVLTGASAIDESMVSGESMPVDKLPGSVVYAGTLTHDGTLRVQATAGASTSTLARIMHMVEEAEASRPRIERLARRIGPRYTLSVFGLAILVLVVGRIGFGLDWPATVYRAMVVLVVASPCAVMIPIPATVLSAIASGALRGIVFKGGDRVEAAGRICVVAFDKTGTLTQDASEVVEVVGVNGTTEHEILATAAAAEQHSEHPLARAVVCAARAREIPAETVTEFRAVPGWGVTANWQGVPIWVGRSVPAAVQAAATIESDLARLQAGGNSTLIVGDNDRGPIGVIAVADAVRPEARESVDRCHKLGVRTVMLTGDNECVAAAIGTSIGITEHRAELRPEDKVDAIRGLRVRYGPIAMVGDGVNDAPALVAADLGIAMGIAGSDVARQAGDVLLVSDDLNRVPTVLEIGRQTSRVLRQNVVWALAVISSLLVLALGGWLTLAFAVLVHEGSTLVGVLNGVRLLQR